MKRELALRRRLRTLHTLSDAASAMKSLSAHHFRLCRQSLPAARVYRDEIERALAEIDARQAVGFAAPAGLLVIVSDLGLCGDYNTRLVQAAVAEQRRQAGPLYCVGRRPRAVLARAEVRPERIYHCPSSVDGLPGLLLRLAQDLLDDFLERRMASLDVISARFEGVGRFSPVLTRVLPISPPPAVRPPCYTPYESPRHVAAIAVREFLYTTLHEILLDALASEHGVRLLAAEAARQWLEQTAETVRRQLAACRREATTQEVLDIVAGGPPHRA